MRIPSPFNTGKWGFNNPFTEYWDDDFRSEKSWEWPEEVVKLSVRSVWRIPAEEERFWLKDNLRNRYIRSYELWS